MLDFDVGHRFCEERGEEANDGIIGRTSFRSGFDINAKGLIVFFDKGVALGSSAYMDVNHHIESILP